MSRTHSATGNTGPVDVGFEQFIEPKARHEFSDGYQRRRQALIREVALASEGRRAPAAQKGATRFTWRAAAAVAVACIAVPTAAWAITSHADFLAGAFGDGWRENQAAEQSYVYDGEKPPVPVVYPASDVVQLDAEAAEELLGDAVCDEPVAISAPDGHELTITSAVRSENALVYRFTLHRDGGVTCLHWDSHTNNVAVKGAYAPPDAQFLWSVPGDDFVYVDPTSSTDETLVGYAYSVFAEPVPEGRSVTLTAYTRDVPSDQDFAEARLHEQRYQIPCTKAVASTTFTSDEGGSVSVSPLGLVLDTRVLFQEPANWGDYDMAQDPGNVRALVVKMDDGDTYTVFDQAKSIDNRLSACGFDTSFSMAFNRLVDPGHIASIEVGVTDAQDMDDLLDANGDWPTDADWPVRTVAYSRS